VQDADITGGHVFPHKVEVNLNMLHALLVKGVGGEVDNADIITAGECDIRQRSMELFK
jgi:hypothetical protein